MLSCGSRSRRFVYIRTSTCLNDLRLGSQGYRYSFDPCSEHQLPCFQVADLRGTGKGIQWLSPLLLKFQRRHRGQSMTQTFPRVLDHSQSNYRMWRCFNNGSFVMAFSLLRNVNSCFAKPCGFRLPRAALRFAIPEDLKVKLSVLNGLTNLAIHDIYRDQECKPFYFSEWLNGF